LRTFRCILGVFMALALATAAFGASPADWDIIVVGGGNGGIPTAIAAANGGAKVLLLEKMPYLGGTLLVAGGQMSAANSKLQLAAGFKDSPEQHYADVMRLGGYRSNPRLLKLQTENAGWTIDWLADLGLKFDKNRPVYMDHHELYSVARSYQPIGSGAAVAKVLIAELNKCVARGDVEVRLETRATELVQNDQGAVIGVRAVGKDGQPLEFRAKHVVLATGGFGSNRELLAHYHGSKGRNALSYTPAFATGDGLQMATAIGADVSHMDLFIPMPGGIEDPNNPGWPLPVRLQLAPATAGYIWVNKLGQRFVNEDTLSPDEKEKAVLRQPDIVTYIILDGNVMDANKPIIANWTWDEFDAEAAKEQNFFKADSIAELAVKLGMNPEVLQATIDRYNGFVEEGRDLDFGRSQLVCKLERPPFYAVETKPMIYLTHGGLKVTADLEVVHVSGKIIPGLYALGEVVGMGQLAGNVLAGGMGNTPPITLGLLLGERLARTN